MNIRIYYFPGDADEIKGGDNVNFPSNENASASIEENRKDEIDNGFFTDDSAETGGDATSNKEKVTALEPDTSPTLADKITVNKHNDDILTCVNDNENDDYVNEDDQAH